MTIHHSIVKSAAGRGINFAYPDEDTVEAKHEASGLVVRVDTSDYDSQNDAAREAWDIVQQIADYNAEAEVVTIHQDLEDRDYVATADGEEIARDPSFEDLLVTASEYLDAKAEAEGDEEEEDERGSVVPAKYKAMYAEAGHPTHCGDWLAETLNRFCRVTDGETGKETTDIDALETIATVNGVDRGRYGKLGMATNGWQGRYRMTVRNMLTPICAGKGFLFVPSDVTGSTDQEIKAPDAWCREHAPKVKAKPEKTDAEKAKKPEGKANAKTKAKKETRSVNEMRAEILEAEGNSQ